MLVPGDDDVLIAVEAWQGTAAVGRVTQAGTRAAALLDRRVLVGANDPCGECDVCRRGGAPVCPRGRLRVVGPTTIAAARWVVPLTDALALPGPTAAAVAGDVALAYTLYARTNIAPRDPVVIVGDSAVARFLDQILVTKGVTPVRAALGGTDADARASVGVAIAALGIGAKPWRILATTPAAAARAAALTGPRSTLTLVGPVATLSGELVEREVMMIGVARAHPDLIVEAAALCVKGDVDLAAGTSLTAEDPTRSFVELVT